ncbi:MAG: hypothetical protein ACYDBP_06755 [Leptospirales bacterium]
MVQNEEERPPTVPESPLENKPESDDSSPMLSEPMTGREWWGLARYFLGGLAVALFFFFMMANGPKGVLVGGVSLLAGLLVWVVYRFVFREVD